MEVAGRPAVEARAAARVGAAEQSGMGEPWEGAQKVDRNTQHKSAMLQSGVAHSGGCSTKGQPK
jgi:hypothetical protein